MLVFARNYELDIHFHFMQQSTDAHDVIMLILSCIGHVYMISSNSSPDEQTAAIRK